MKVRYKAFSDRLDMKDTFAHIIVGVCRIAVITSILGFPLSCSKKSTKTETTLQLSDLPGTVVYTSDRDGNWNIYISRFDSEEATCITPNSTADNSYPLWIDNGHKLVFISDDGSNSRLYRMNDLSNPEGSLESLVELEGNKAFPELSPDGSYILFFNKGLTDTQHRLYKLILDTGQLSVVSDDMGMSQMRFIGEDRLAIWVINGPLSELDLNSGSIEEYVYNHEQLDNWGTVSALDVSERSGRAYGAVSRTEYYTRNILVTWNYHIHSGYTWLSQASTTIQVIDSWRDFRIIDMGSDREYYLHSTKVGDVYTASSWKIALGECEGAIAISGKKTLEDMAGDNRHPDWTDVEHIIPW